MTSRRDFLRTVGLGSLTLAAPGPLSAATGPSARTPAAKPNVILIMTDDQGYGDLACLGNSIIKTPGLDALYGESVRLSDFHVDPCCSPTRAALLTGRYSTRAGVWHTVCGRSLLAKDEVTMANVFASAGYRTGIFGKWHLGDNYPFRPQDRGFQEVLVHGAGGVGNSPDYWGNDYFDDTYFHNGRPETFKGYCTDVWFNEAMTFIRANRGRPFFCYVPTNVPHGPYRVPEKYAAPYKGKAPAKMANFYGMITNFDENLMRLERELKDLGLRENTILVFLTDNGTAAGVRLDRSGHVTEGFNAGMRGAKIWEYEGGHRVPCFIRWPAGGIGGGRNVEPLTAHFDLLPTLIDLCGLKQPAGVKMDGASLAPLLRGADRNRPKRTLFVHNQRVDHPVKWKNCQVMTDRWRLVNGGELYDIKADPGQRKNVAEAHPEVVQQLRKAYETWWADISTHFAAYPASIIGSDKANPTALWTHDWHGPQLWHQSQVKGGPDRNGFWAIEVARDGRYEIELRRWPKEVNQPITARFEGGRATPATHARLLVGNADQRQVVTPDMVGVTFTVHLKAGPTCLVTWFIDEKSNMSRGAYYVYVKRTGPGDPDLLAKYEPSRPEDVANLSNLTSAPRKDGR